MKGLFITFEGIDGSGKTTQLHLTAKILRERGYEVVESREPGGTLLAEKVRNLVLNPDLPLTTTTQTLLYLAARSEHTDKLLLPAIKGGKIVLCDRFSDSTVVYQGLSQGKNLEETAELRKLCNFSSGGLTPDLTLLFDGRPEILLSRRQQRGVNDRYELQGLDFQQKLRRGFRMLAEAEPERICIINAENSYEEVTALVLAAIDKLLEKE